ncbi:MAG: GNAT family N-acetyltransferase [Candidatus Marinimicrobia bacterium]|nr:GNAT family N-acetyltransferase [Candidatus Neomarinimicrobiota bacterium]
MNLNIIIRGAVIDDLEACVAIDAPNFNIFDRAKRRKHFVKMIPEDGMLVLEHENSIVAYATFEPDWFGCTFLKLVVTDVSVRRKGLAALLIQYVEDHHCPSGKFFSSTEDDNEASKKLHEKLGFKVSGWLDNLPQPHREIFYFKLIKKDATSSIHE